jgi:putative ABC transport system permease protein
MRSASRLAALRPGFRAETALAFDLSLRGDPRYNNTGAADRTASLMALEAPLRGLPGVVTVGFVNRIPLGERRWTNGYGLPGEPPESWRANAADFRMVSPDYFRAMGTRVVSGRAFTEEENRVERQRVVIVDEVLARRIAPGGRAIGRRLAFPLDGKPVSAEVVGVVEPVRFASLWEPPRGAFYVPYRHEASRDLSFVVRMTGDPATLTGSVPRLVHEFDANLAVFNVRPMSAYVDDSTATVRFALVVLTGFAGAAIALALFGVFATLSHAVAQRRREIGVRMALGATAQRVTAEVLGSGVAVVAVGTGVGLVLAVATGHGLRALLFDVHSTDPLVLAAVGAMVVLIGIAAAALPAFRAARTDPMESIRAD